MSQQETAVSTTNKNLIEKKDNSTSMENYFYSVAIRSNDLCLICYKMDNDGNDAGEEEINKGIVMNCNLVKKRTPIKNSTIEIETEIEKFLFLFGDSMDGDFEESFFEGNFFKSIKNLVGKYLFLS
jgi:hypothetical protein